MDGCGEPSAGGHTWKCSPRRLVRKKLLKATGAHDKQSRHMSPNTLLLPEGFPQSSHTRLFSPLASFPLFFLTLHLATSTHSFKTYLKKNFKQVVL